MRAVFWHLCFLLLSLTSHGVGGCSQVAVLSDVPDSTATIYQAEDIKNKDISGCTKKDTYPNSSGTGYIDFGGPGTWIQWRTLAKAGKYKLSLRYANGSPDVRKAHVEINGMLVKALDFAITRSSCAKEDGWYRWSTVSFIAELKKGPNVIRLTADTAGPNVDYLALGPASDNDDQEDDSPSDEEETITNDEEEAVSNDNGIYEAEDLDPSTQLHGCIPVLDKNSGASGEAFVDFTDGSGSWLEWRQISAIKGAQEHQLIFRYANGSPGPLKTYLFVNDVLVETISFESTASWTTWDTASVLVPLHESVNTVRLEVSADSTGPHIDYLQVVDSTKSDICTQHTLPPEARLMRGERLCSPNGFHELALNGSGRFVLRVKGAVVWDAKISGADYLTMQSDGNLVAYGALGSLWASKTANATPRNAASLHVLNSGSAELRKNGQVAWCVSKDGIGCGGGGRRKPATGELKIVIFSVNSADSSLIIFPTGRTMMVDSATHEKFEERVMPFLIRHGIDHLDYYIETHPHLDHVGGRNQLKQRGIVNKNTKIWDWSSFDYEDSFPLEGTQWFIYNARDVSFHGTDTNANSVSFRMEYNGFVYTTSGDEYDDSQNRFLHDHPDLVPAHVRNTAHHMWGPVSYDFLVATDPYLFVVSCSVRVRNYRPFAIDFMGAVTELKNRRGRLEEYVVTEESGHVLVKASGSEDWSYDFCKKLSTCSMDI